MIHWFPVAGPKVWLFTWGDFCKMMAIRSTSVVTVVDPPPKCLRPGWIWIFCATNAVATVTEGQRKWFKKNRWFRDLARLIWKFFSFKSFEVLEVRKDWNLKLSLVNFLEGISKASLRCRNQEETHLFNKKSHQCSPEAFWIPGRWEWL